MPVINNVRIYPIENNPSIGRYMDLTKFVSMISRKALFFTRVDKQEDPFEGTYPKANNRLRKEWYREQERTGFFKDKISDELIDQNIRNYDNVAFMLKAITCINCWHQNDVENALMWRAYCSTNAGILIKSRYAGLFSVLNSAPQNIVISGVRYLNYSADGMPDGNTLFPFIHKQLFYEGEREIRAIHEVSQSGWVHKWDEEESEFGVYIPVNLEDLIEEIVIAPFAPQWFLEMIRSLAEKYELDKPIRRSGLAS